MGKLSKDEELDLVKRAIKNDAEAFRSIVLFYEKQLLTYLNRIVGSQEDAYDITQETFIAAYKALSSWVPPLFKDSPDGVSNHTHILAPWLYRIATNRAFIFINKRASQERKLLFEPIDQTDQNMYLLWQSTDDVTIEDQYAENELLREALNQLSEEDAVCLILRFVCSEPYADIARYLGLTKEAVRKRVTRGLVVLRSAYSALNMEIPK